MLENGANNNISFGYHTARKIGFICTAFASYLLMSKCEYIQFFVQCQHLEPFLVTFKNV